MWLYDLWWFKHSLVDLHQWPVFNPEMFYPFGYALSLSETMLANKALIFPILILGNEVVAFNSLLFLSFVLSGLGMYLLVTYLTGSKWAGVIAGVIFAYCPYRMHAMAAGWLPLISTQWIPLLFLSLERMLRERKARFAIGSGVLLAVNVLSSWYYAYVVGLFAALYLLVRLWPWRTSLRDAVVWRNVLLMGTVSMLLVAPVVLPVIRGGGATMSWSLREVEKWAASLEDFFLPNVYHPIWGRAVLSSRRHVPSYPWYVPGFVYLGWVALVLAFIGLRSWDRSRPAMRALLWIAGLSFVVALGTTLHWGGERVYIPVPGWVEGLFSRAMYVLTGRLALNPAEYHLLRATNAIMVPLPALLAYLFVPFAGGMRTLYRFGLVTVFAVAVLAGMGVAALGFTGEEEKHEAILDVPASKDGESRRRDRRRIPIPLLGSLLVALVLFDFASFPLPYGFSKTAAQLLDEHMAKWGEGAVMQFPLIRGLNGPMLYRSVYHRHPMAYGHGTFYPEEFLAVKDAELANFPSDETLDLLRTWGVRWVLVGEGAYDEGWGDLPDQDWSIVSAAIESSGRLRPVMTVQEEPLWFGERVSDVIEGCVPVDPISVDTVHVYELVR
ncbi:MAG: YfhO family protein [Chloroflexota bacterium]